MLSVTVKEVGETLTVVSGLGLRAAPDHLTRHLLALRGGVDARAERGARLAFCVVAGLALC